MGEVLLLNADYLPLNVITWKKALHLHFKEKVFPVEYYDDWFIYNGEIQIPAVVVLRRRVSFKEIIKFSKENICIRDKFSCQYCGVRLRAGALELEHIMPQSRGGKRTFENIVASCRPCNASKGDKTPIEAGMQLLSKPARPSSIQCRMFKVARTMKHPSWEKYAGIYSTFTEANK